MTEKETRIVEVTIEGIQEYAREILGRDLNATELNDVEALFHLNSCGLFNLIMQNSIREIDPENPIMARIASHAFYCDYDNGRWCAHVEEYPNSVGIGITEEIALAGIFDEVKTRLEMEAEEK